MAGKLVSYLGMPVDGVIAENSVDQFAGWYCTAASNPVQKTDEFLMAMTLPNCPSPL
jgi:hypothetical protein